jgi:hypothetical protein
MNLIASPVEYRCSRCGSSLVDEWEEELRVRYVEWLRLDLSGPFGDLEFEEWLGGHVDAYCEWCDHVARKD